MNYISDFLPQHKAEIEQVPAIMPSGALVQIRQGILPSIRTNRIMLAPNEICHFSERAILLTEKVQKRYVGSSSSISLRICKGVTYRTGQKRAPVEETYTEKNKGFLYVTSKRIIFVSDKNAFEKALNKLTSVTPYSNAVKFQFSSKTYTMLVPDGVVINILVSLLNNA